MLKERELDTKPAGRYAYAAALAADRYSEECRVLYTAQEQAKAETMRDVVSLAYMGKRIFVTYRKTFVTVKVDQPEVRDRRVVRELEAICQERGYVKTRSAQGIAFRILAK